MWRGYAAFGKTQEEQVKAAKSPDTGETRFD
jgi:hypothetical protein